MKTEKEKVMQIIKRGQYDSRLCESGVVYLKEIRRIISIMEKGNYYNSVCDAGIPALKLKERDRDELFWIMSEAKYNYQVCEAGVKTLAAIQERAAKRIRK